MADLKEKEINLKYNGKVIQVRIQNNYLQTLKSIKLALKLTDDEMNKLTISFMDEDGDENMLDEENFEQAFNFDNWIAN